jgi:hypothetical protein
VSPDWTRVQRVFEAHRESLIAVPGVTGTAIGTCEGEPCIRIFVSSASVLEGQVIPGTLDGIPVKIEVSGVLHARE